jgi:hypothetical protein
MYYYPPPYNGGYATPWLWYDGNETGSYSYSTWNSKIVNRMNQAAPVTATMWGSYAPTEGSGTVSIQFRNDSTATINGRVIVVITEDSLYYPTTPNGDQWHNHVARDWVPNTNGQVVTIPAGDSVTVTQSFTIQSTWVEEKCTILAWIQDDNYISQRKEIWQGAMKPLMEFVGVKEHEKDVIASYSVITAPNPCVSGTAFSFALPVDQDYRIDLYESNGRLVRTIQGSASGHEDHVQWDLKDAVGQKVSSGVYLYRFSSGTDHRTGTVVVR